MTRVAAIASISSSKPSSVKKLSTLEPMWTFPTAVFTVLTFQAQRLTQEHRFE